MDTFLTKNPTSFTRVSPSSYWHSTFLFQQPSALRNIRVFISYCVLTTVSVLKLLFLNTFQVLKLNKPFCSIPSFKNSYFLVRAHSPTNILKLPLPNIIRKHILINPTQACFLAICPPFLLSHLEPYSTHKFPKCLTA